MTWLIWRQHRMQSAAASVMLAAFAILLAITGVTMANDYHNALSSCSQRGVDCSGLTLFRGDGAIIDLVNLTVAVPLLIGVFWGATSIGREYDSGTNVLAWTQSVSRRRWLAAKIATLLDQLEAQLDASGGPWLLGHQYTILDPYALMLCRWTRGFAKPARQWPLLGAYLQRMLERPAVQRAIRTEGLDQPLV